MGDATCEIREPGTVQTWNPVTEQNDLTPHAPYYAGGCRVNSRTNDARQVVTAEDPETVTRYIVSVPADVATAETVGHLLTMTSSDDAAMTGRTLIVTDVVLGSHRFERDLICTLDS